jgi:hypothetical protein
MAGLCFDLSGNHPNIKIQRVVAAMPSEQPPWKIGGTGLRRSDGFFVTAHEKAPVGA